MVPLNLLTVGTTADYVNTGSWAEKAAKEPARGKPEQSQRAERTADRRRTGQSGG